MSIEIAEEQEEILAPLPIYKSIVVAVDASDHSNKGVYEATAIGTAFGAKITGAHVFAAKLHDVRFRQMEGGLPEQFREEEELEKQRDIHDDLITKGLGVITDSYLDQAEIVCQEKGLEYMRSSLEGKNYTEMFKEANSGKYDLLIMGSLGLGSIPGSRIGTVCERVTRRSNIDTLIIKQPDRNLSDGPIVVAVDGSARSYGGLLTAFSLAQEWDVPVHVISVYDPYYHYVAFNRIAKVLSNEAGKIFRFKEQEKLHEDIIDAGLAKIYEGHLLVAQSIAEDYGIEIQTKLLDGKPHDAIEKYITEADPSLLVIGKLGIHADADLDIGGNAENLMRNVECAILLSQNEYIPRIDVVAEATTQWTYQAEKRLENVPSFARGMARMGILRMAQARGHTVITEKIVDEATATLCPVMITDDEDEDDKDFNPDWTIEARRLADTINNPSLKENAMKRAEKKARQSDSMLVTEDHIAEFVKPEVAAKVGKCPFGHTASDKDEGADFPWSKDAMARLEKVPDGFMRSLTKQRVETFAKKNGKTEITPEVMDDKYEDWGEGSAKQSMTMEWDETTMARLERIPDFVQGMIILETERCARALGEDKVTREVMKKASSIWEDKGAFHSEGSPNQYSDDS